MVKTDFTVSLQVHYDVRLKAAADKNMFFLRLTVSYKTSTIIVGWSLVIYYSHHSLFFPYSQITRLSPWYVSTQNDKVMCFSRNVLPLIIGHGVLPTHLSILVAFQQCYDLDGFILTFHRSAWTAFFLITTGNNHYEIRMTVSFRGLFFLFLNT